MPYLLGLDLSTTGAKALVIDDAGETVATHSTPHDLSAPQPLWSEQDPEAWWRGMSASIRAVVAQVGAENIGAVGLTGQMHSLVCLDADNHVLRPAILWNDQRTGAQCEAIVEALGLARLVATTGNRALTGFTAPKILWIRDHEPEVYTRIAHVLVAKDYIRFCLTGDYATDVNEASGMLLMNVGARGWAVNVLEALDIPPAWLPTTYEGPAITGTISAAGAAATGLRAGTLVVGGGGDQAAQAVGVGAVVPGTVALTVGTSGVVFAPLNAYNYEPEGRLHALCHSVPGMWHFMGVTLSAAGSLQWYRDTLSPDMSFDALIAEAARVSANSDGLQFAPYLTGERTPHPDPLARGAFVGLTSRHTRGHLTRAVLEGVAFSLRDVFELIRASEAGKHIQQVRISGGGAQSPVWRQIFADVLNVPLVSVEALEGAAYGAALLAGVGAGVWADVHQAAGVVGLGEETHPGADAAVYAERYLVYEGLYPALRETFARLG
jgi:xylulokinase